MPELVTSSSTVQCTHSGSCTATEKVAKVKVNGSKVIPKSTSYMVSGCSLPPPIAANGPCVKASPSSGSSKVKAGGKKILLKDFRASCTPTGASAKCDDAGQTKVKGK